MIPMPALLYHPDVDRDDIPFAKRLAIRKSMYHHVIDGDTGRKGISPVIQEGRHSVIIPDKFGYQLVQLQCRHTRLQYFGNLSKCSADESRAIAHQLDL